MKFKTPLLPGTLIKRYKRFLADVQTATGEIITIHCPNSGSMKGLVTPGLPVWYSTSPNLNRRLPHTLELVEVDGTYVGINTQHPNTLVEEALHARTIPELISYSRLKREVKISPTSRLDFVLESPTGIGYVEVKNVTLKEESTLYFPDSVTSRGVKHLRELIRLQQQGYSTFMLYVAQRSDESIFSIEKDIDPLYFKHVKDAIDAGVQILAYGCTVSLTGIELTHPLSIQIEADQ